MRVLDTDTYSLIVRGRSPEALRVRDRLEAVGQPEIVTVVTVEEQLEGRIADCNRATTPEQYATVAERLQTTVTDLSKITVLPFTPDAADEFRRLKARKIRIGTSDLRIAAIVLSLDATLITRNLSDFRKVPGLKAEDWTRPV